MKGLWHRRDALIRIPSSSANTFKQRRLPPSIPLNQPQQW